MKTTLLSLFVILTMSASAQLDYYFNSFEATYEEFEDGTDAVIGSWDDPDMIVPIGFEIDLAGTPTSTLYFLSDFLGGTAIADPFADTWDMLWVTSADLTDAGYASDEYLSPVTYKTEGEPGSQIFKMQWQDAGFYPEASNGPAFNLINFQLWIHESSNTFEVRWGPNTIKETQYVLEGWFSTGFLADATQDQEFSQGLFLSGQGNMPAPVLGEDVDALFTAQLLSIPSNGTVYQFTTEPVSVANETLDDWAVYPTVTNGNILFKGSNELTTYRVFNLAGKIVEQGNFTTQHQTDLGRLESGVYLVELASGDERKTSRIIKK